MRTTFNLDDRLLGEASASPGMTERTDPDPRGMRALIGGRSAGASRDWARPSDR